MIKIKDVKQSIVIETIYKSWFKIDLLTQGRDIIAVRFGCMVVPYEPFLNADNEYAQLIYDNHKSDIACESKQVEAKERARRLRIALNLAKLLREREANDYNILWIKHKIKEGGL